MGSCLQIQTSSLDTDIDTTITQALTQIDEKIELCDLKNENHKHYALIGTGFNGNGYQQLLHALESDLLYSFPKSLICLIAEFSHISLKQPSNRGHHEDFEHEIFETLHIDNKNSLSVHYIPDPNMHHYHNPDWSTFERYDYIESYPSFPHHSSIYSDSDEYGNMIYFEVTLKLNESFIEFVKAHWLIISIGLRTDTWRDYIDDKIEAINGGLVGWTKQSIGFHSDDGKIFIESGRGGKDSTTKSYGESDGDIIGCGYNYDKNVVFFTKNGGLVSSVTVNFIQSSFDAVMSIKATKDIFETVLYRKMRENGDDIQCLFEFNFGDKPFAFDIDDYNSNVF